MEAGAGGTEALEAGVRGGQEGPGGEDRGVMPGLASGGPGRRREGRVQGDGQLPPAESGAGRGASFARPPVCLGPLALWSVSGPRAVHSWKTRTVIALVSHPRARQGKVRQRASPVAMRAAALLLS